MYKKNAGLGIIKLILILIIIIALICVGIYFGRDLLNKDNLESVKTDMMKIEGKAILIADEYEMDETKGLIGIKIDRTEDGYKASEGDYELTSELQQILEQYDKKEIKKIVVNEEGEEVEEVEQEGEEALYYIWTQADLENKGLGSIKVDNIQFYVVDYKGLKVFYSLGYEGIYELNELRDKEI